MVFCFFWFYVYPLVDPKLLSSAFTYISSHGGVNFVLSIRFLYSNIELESHEIMLPIKIVAFYFLVVIIPSSLVGMTIYPYFMESLKLTILGIFEIFASLSTFFYIGLYLKPKKSLKNS
jgi:hypothetical protein